MMGRDWTETRRALEDLLELSASEREAALVRLESDDPAQHAELCSLLAADDDSPSWLDEGAGALLEGSADDREDDPGPDSVVGHYRIEGEAGRGASARVYRARDTRVPRSVALKVLRHRSSSSTSDRFEIEKRSLASLQHPGIVALLDVGMLEDGRSFLVTEWVDGVPIDQHARDHADSLSDRLRLFEELCRAVQHAHSHLLVHRDLKPSNVLVTGEGRVKVLDFGIAKLLDGAPGESRHIGRGPLTLSHASPEQLRGDPITVAVDVWALGVILHQLIGGAHPFADRRGERLEQAILEGTRDRLTGVDADLHAIVDRALQPAAQGRYHTAERLADDVRAYLERRPVSARSTPPLHRLRLLARRRPLPTALTVALVSTLIVAALIWRELSQIRLEGERIAWRAHADAVYATNYLADVLVRVGSGEIRDEPSVRAMLEEAEGRIANELGGAPEAEARLRHAVARVYGSLGDLERAEPHARRALALSRDTRGLGLRDVISNLELIAELIEDRDPADARALREEAGDLRESLS